MITARRLFNFPSASSASYRFLSILSPPSLTIDVSDLESRLRSVSSSMCSDLQTQGYWTSPPLGPSALLPPPVVAALRRQAVALNKEGRFEASFSETVDAETGGKTKFYKPGVYACEPDGGDYETAPDMVHYMSVLLRTLPPLLNASSSPSSSPLSLSSSSFNAKLAVTKPGGSKYPLHVDNVVGPSGGDRRKLTFILYLNPHYDPASDGGELRLYNDAAAAARGGAAAAAAATTTTVDVRPEGGRALAFWSDEIPHEVLPAAPGAREDDESKDRYALTIWIPTDDLRAIHHPMSKFKDLRESVFEERSKLK